MVALALVAGVFWTGSNTILDLASPPATVRGTVSSHFIQSNKGNPTRYVQVGGVTYTVTPAVYAHTTQGQCAVLTYGPHSKVATATAACR